MIKNLVSIIIPLYNSQAYISECIASCLKQTHKNIEIIVVDDGSTDDGLDIVKRIAHDYKKIHVIHTKNNGVSSARNIGLKKASGDYICFTDADDSIEKNFVSTFLHYMQQYNSDFCFSINTWSKNNSNNNSAKVISSTEAEAMLLSQRVKVGCWNKMYKKATISNLHFRNDLFYGEGLYFINQVAHQAKNIVVCEDGLYHYRKVNPESATTKFDIKKMINGEKSLLDIKANIIKNDGAKVNQVWAQHYCLFCVNAMFGLLRNANDNSYKKWHHKMRKYIVPAMRSNGKLKTKAKLLLASLSPKLCNIIMRTKNE